MFEYLVNLDHSIFLFINVHLANPVTNLIMPYITSDFYLRIFYAISILLLLWKGDKEVRWLVLFSIITLACTDLITSHVLKQWFARSRPCQTLPDINLLVNCGAGLSMPSSHAANAFGQAVLFGFMFKHVRWWLLGLASIIAISRVFVGVHYPADIVVGALVGIVVGIGVIFWYKKIITSKQKITPQLSPGG
jgi:membrane-associated phospholipid phosphatase